MGKTVLLIPGWHEKAHDLRTITHGRPPLPGLAARGFDPITFELRQESLPERIDRFARFVRELKLREPDRFPAILVGYSMGAIVSLIAASHEPRIRRLIIGGVGAGVVERGGVDTRAISSDALRAALIADDPSTITNRVAAGFRTFADSTGADRWALAAQAASVHRESIDLERITAPTLVLVGRSDDLAVRPQVLAGAIPGAELLIIDGDHLGAVGVPAFATAIVDFING